MNATGIPIFELAEKKLAWTEQRQALLARNVANVATPHFQPRDATAFSQMLAGKHVQSPTQTQPRHLGGTQSSSIQSGSVPGHSRAPDGNGVLLDEQLTKIANTETQQSVATSIYKKYMGMFSLVLGRS